MKDKKLVILAVFMFLSALFLCACQGESKSRSKKGGPGGTVAKRQEGAVGESAAPGTHPAAAEQAGLSGKVVETMDSGGYTYVLLEKDGVRTWAAMPETKVAVGDEVTLQPGAEMVNFHSNTLNRTFARIIFCGGIVGAKAGAGSIGPHGPAPRAAVGDVHVEKASGPNAYTVSELHEKAEKLDKKTVVVRGKVVKVLPNIMNKTWIHIQDGTGDPGRKTNDIVVTTTKGTPSVGDVVNVTGTLYKDKDFGAGYKYHAIIEEATVEKE